MSGVVTDATRSAKVKGRAHLAFRFDTLVPEGLDERYRIDTATISREAAATKEKDAVKIGAPAAGGAILGALLGGKKGALIGTAVGGGAGTAVVLSTRGEEVRLAKGAALTLRLTKALTIRVKEAQGSRTQGGMRQAPASSVSRARAPRLLHLRATSRCGCTGWSR